MDRMVFTEEVEKYDAPQVEIVEVEVERGFSESQLESPGKGGDI